MTMRETGCEFRDAGYEMRALNPGSRITHRISRISYRATQSPLKEPNHENNNQDADGSE